MTALDESRVQRFLDGKEVALLATVQADGAPLAMPMWFLHDAAAVTMISLEGTQKIRNLRADFLADGPERRALVERFHQKYPRLQQLWGGRTMPPDRVMFRIVPARARTWGL